MKKFTKLISTCLSIPTENIDTDQIIPARFLKLTTRKGFGEYLFYDWRFDDNGKPKNNPYFHGSIYETKKILVASNNFGCGSSREHAVWAIQDFGFKAIISSSYGDIFYNNALKNGLLPVIITPSELKKLFQVIKNQPQTKVTADLEHQYISFNNHYFSFPINSFRKTCLLKGVDELGYILSMEDKIKKIENSHLIFIST
jgi:3-isopropylmalate/(R)-2-methylmalate dehydratase small subunit